MDLSIVLPVYNEAETLEPSIRKVLAHMRRLDYSFEIIIAEDGSGDGTAEIACELAEENSRIRLLHSDERLGRGKALKRAFKKCVGEILLYSDIDLSIDLDSIQEAVRKIKQSYDVCIGSRLLQRSKVQRDIKRSIASKGYNLLARVLFNSKITDLQCGFKVFKRKVLLYLLRARNNHWFWDTEVLLRLEKENFKIYQLPVKWREMGSSKVHILKSIFGMGSRLIKLRLKMF